MKNIIYYYYNIKISKINNQNNNYYFYYNNNLFFLIPYNKDPKYLEDTHLWHLTSTKFDKIGFFYHFYLRT
jgi:hypothetical protein